MALLLQRESLARWLRKGFYQLERIMLRNPNNISIEDNGSASRSLPFSAPGYEALAEVFERAFVQASHGKGRERHSQDKPFHEQPMQTISDLLESDAGMAFQAIKKIREARGLAGRDARIRELLGAINYVAGMVIREQMDAAEPVEAGRVPL